MANKISKAIDVLGWQRKDLAEQLDKYSSEISKWLKGGHNFTFDTLSDIEEVLGINLFDLNEGSIQVIQNEGVALPSVTAQVDTPAGSNESYTNGKFSTQMSTTGAIVVPIRSKLELAESYG